MFKVAGFRKTLRTMMIRVGAALTLLASLFSFATVYAVGETWWPLGSGMDKEVYALAFDSSGNLYAGGSFTTAGGVPANRIAKWDGTSWSSLGSGVNAEVYALAVDNSGNLYAGGAFTSAGGVGASHIAKWDGTSWSALGDGTSGRVNALKFNASSDLYAGGSFTAASDVDDTSHVAKWNSSVWSALDSGTSSTVRALAVDNSGNLYAGGDFATAGGAGASHIAKWNGTSWSALGDGTSGRVNALKFDASGNLYAGGSFTTADGDVTVNHIAKWDGTSWSALSSGVNGGDVYALAFDSSGNLYVGGSFTSAGGVTANRVAKWYGSVWSALESGVGVNDIDIVRALLYDDSGNLYAGGGFTSAGSVSANRIARWGVPLPGILPTTGSSLFCTGESTIISLNLTDVVDLYGYQFVVNYDHSLVSASGAFLNSFFDTTSPHASIPTGWNAVCNEGQCKFAVTKLAPGEPVSGSGAVAQITLTGLSAGTFDLTLSQDILSNRDGRARVHKRSSLPLTVCGYATVSGKVSLQGRSTPINAGTVTLTDLGGVFGPYTTSFDAATGAFTISSIKVMPGGSDYQFDAAHGLYLSNRTTHVLNPLESYPAPSTRLLGGDANNDGTINIYDLSCIGGSFGSTPPVAPATCVSDSTTGNSDVNADGAVNILDLVLSGGNYGLTSP